MTKEETKALAQARINAAKRLLHEVEINIQYEFYNSAMSRMYYACFYATLGALATKGYDQLKTHEGVIRMLNKEFINTKILDRKYTLFMSRLYDCRAEADYDAFENYTREDVEEFLPDAHEYVNLLDNYITSVL